MTKKLALVLIFAMAAFGCVHVPGGIAPSTTPLQPGQYTELGKVEGRDCLWRLLGLIPLGPGNTLEKARDNAIAEKSGANALADVTVDAYTQFWIIVARDCTEVRGIAVRK